MDKLVKGKNHSKFSYLPEKAYLRKRKLSAVAIADVMIFVYSNFEVLNAGNPRKLDSNFLPKSNSNFVSLDHGEEK